MRLAAHGAGKPVMEHRASQTCSHPIWGARGQIPRLSGTERPNFSEKGLQMAGNCGIVGIVIMVALVW